MTSNPAVFNLRVGSSDAKSFGRLITKSGVERDAALEELKVYGRDPSYAAPIFTKEVRRVLPTS
jgi:hypothetical protein